MKWTDPMAFSSSIKNSVLRALVLSTAMALVTGKAAAQQSTDFEALGYGGATAACKWNGADSMIGSHSGFTFYGLRALDLANYQKCWAESPTPSQQNYYAKTGVVALGSEQALVQANAGSSSFILEKLSVGAGWTTPVTITMRAGSWAAGQFYTKSWDITGGATRNLDLLPTNVIDYFWLDVDWNEELFAEDPDAYDPFNSRARRAELGYTDGNPYATYFIDNMRVTVPVPEPGTFGLVAAGLACLAAVARRRRSTK